MGKITMLVGSALIMLFLIPNKLTAKNIDGWIANSYGISKNRNCMERAMIAFKKAGLVPKVDKKVRAVYYKNKEIIAQVRCVNDVSDKEWWYVMVVGDKRIKVRNIIDSELRK